MNARSNGRDGGGVGGGGDVSGPDDETVVVVTEEYTRRAIGRLADGLRDAADLCDGFREGGEAASLEERIAILDELGERLEEVKVHAEGSAPRRAEARTRADHKAQQRTTLEGDTMTFKQFWMMIRTTWQSRPFAIILPVLALGWYWFSHGHALRFATEKNGGSLPTWQEWVAGAALLFDEVRSG